MIENEIGIWIVNKFIRYFGIYQRDIKYQDMVKVKEMRYECSLQILFRIVYSSKLVCVIRKQYCSPLRWIISSVRVFRFSILQIFNENAYRDHATIKTKYQNVIKISNIFLSLY